MARVESQSVGGFFATPPHVIPSIAALFTVPPPPPPEHGYQDKHSYSIVDPCAGDGEAVFGIAKALWAGPKSDLNIYTCEMEATRSDTCKHRYQSGVTTKHVHGDAMRVVWETKDHLGASLAYVNAPYDTDPTYKRLEERFARRFVGCLADRGVWVDVRPFYALAASADTFARHLTDVHCFRFPEDDFQVFKQVVLVGVKRPALAEPDPEVRARVLAWSESAESMPVLGSQSAVVTLPAHPYYHSGFSEWQIAPLDLQGLVARSAPWCSTERSGRSVPIPGVAPNPGDMLARRYPLAVPPKPAHLAAAIASGVFNGAEVEPDAGMGRRLRVKGVFDKDFVKVEDKQNKEGEKTGEVQVQQPKLVVTVLDCASGTYYTLRSSAESTGSLDPSQMTTGDLLRGYGRALMRVMADQCPVLHDPQADSDRFAMPEFPRKLYRAQEEAVRAAVKLLGGAASTTSLPSRGKARIKALRARSRSHRTGRAAYILGEIGSGKSFCALATAATIGAERVLVMCPPHLLQGWADQARASVPWARVSVLADVGDVDTFCADRDQGMHVAIVSREAAKLGHSYRGVSGSCPACSAQLPVDKDGIAMASDELAKKRARCVARRRVPADELARVASDVALSLMLVMPASVDVNQLCRGRVRDKMMISAATKIGKGKVDEAAWSRARPVVLSALKRLGLEALRSEARGRTELVLKCMTGLLASLREDAVTESLCERLYLATVFDQESYSVGAEVRTWCRDVLLLMKDPKPVAERLKALKFPNYHGTSDPWSTWEKRREALADKKGDPESYRSCIGCDDGHLTINKHDLSDPTGQVKVAVESLAKLTELAAWTWTEQCSEPLYQAIPEPRRYPLAKYLVRRYPRTIDLFIHDEAHEAQNSDSAQSLAAHRIVGTGVPTLALTGSVMNGYAVSLFANQWALDPQFREEFRRDALRDFNRRYGYIKQLVQQTDKDGKVVEWGSQSERRETVREIGNAPGVLPLFLLRYLLRMAVTLHKSDLALDLPKCSEIVEYVEPDAEIRILYESMLKVLKDQIKKDRFGPLSGKLFGMMSEIPSYLDRATADTGNREDGSYEVAYPEGEEDWGGRVLAREDGLPATTILPKERRMLEVVEGELKEGRRVMLFAWHEAVLPRLQRLVERELKEPCALLRADKVQAAKRQAWIDREVIARGRRVLVVNPVAVQTGLNNLVWFATEWWHQNPACNPIVYRQAVGRVDRIGQKMETRIYIPVYDGTAQVLANRLTMHKVGVSLAADGLDAESALQAAGVGESDSLDAFSVGRALFEMMERGESERVRAEERPANDVAPPVPVATPSPTVQPKRARAGAAQLDLFDMMKAG